MIKDPNEVLDYKFDFSAWLTAGETISASTVTVGTDVTKDSDTHDNTTVTVWLSGGTAPGRCAVTAHITTTQGRQKDFTRYIDIRDN